MKITSIESRVLGYDVAEAWGGAEPARGHLVDLVPVLVRHLPHRRRHRRLHDAERQPARRRSDGPTSSTTCTPRSSSARTRSRARRSGTSCAGSTATPTTCPTASPARSTSRSGTSAARSPTCRSPRCSGWRARRSRRTPPPATSTRRPRTSSRRRAERKAQGYHGFKIQFWDGLDRDIPRFRAAREAVGDDYPLMQDAAGHVHLHARRWRPARSSASSTTTWFEEPIPDRNLFQLQRLTDQLDVPILAGETSRVHELAEGMRMGAFDIARGDVHMKEGITGLHKAVGMADLLGFDLEVHGINQPLLDTANLHVALSMTNGRWSETFHPIYYRGLKGDPLDIDAEGYKHLPTGPGPRRRARLGLDRRRHREVVRTPAASPASQAGSAGQSATGNGRRRPRATSGSRPSPSPPRSARRCRRSPAVGRRGPPRRGRGPARRTRAGSTARARPRSCSASVNRSSR